MIARARALLFALLVLLGVGDTVRAASEARALVLVAGKASHLTPLDPNELRRLYLGRSVGQDGIRLVPLHNVTDPLLYESFLQKVVFMSAQSYERHLLTRVYQTGGKRPREYDRLPELEQALQRDPGRVTFMWRADAQAMPDVTIIQELWRESAP